MWLDPLESIKKIISPWISGYSKTTFWSGPLHGGTEWKCILWTWSVIVGVQCKQRVKLCVHVTLSMPNYDLCPIDYSSVLVLFKPEPWHTPGSSTHTHSVCSVRRHHIWSLYLFLLSVSLSSSFPTSFPRCVKMLIFHLLICKSSLNLSP